MNYIYLFFIALISATIFPMGSEALLLYDISINLNIYLLFLFATFGNSLGSVVNYWLGLKGEEYLVNHKLLKEKHILKGKNYFDKFGILVKRLGVRGFGDKRVLSCYVVSNPYT